MTLQREFKGDVERSVGKPSRARHPQAAWQAYAWGVAGVAACTGVAWLMYGRFELANIIMIYLLGVVAVATLLGRGPAILVSFLSVAAFDFFFVPPRWTFQVAETQYLVTFAVMLVVAVVISALANRVRWQAETAQQRERRTAALLALSRELAATPALDQVLAATARQVAEVFASKVAVLTPDGQQGLGITTGFDSGFPIGDREMPAARWAFEHREPAGLGTATMPDAMGLHLPLLASRGTVGVLSVAPAEPGALRDVDQLRLLEAFANQAALAIERAKLADEAHSAWERVEAEFMRNTLLSSVSHDLRTPLAAITGAASSLVEAETSLDPAARRDLAETICDESERMERLINNLLDMTRVESGGMKLQKEWQPLQEVIGSALHHLRKRLQGREVQVNLAGDLPLVPFDAVGIEQVIINLVDNSLQYTSPETPIEIAAARAQGGVMVEVLDRGPGLPAGAELRVFDKFFRAPTANFRGSRGGIGLGLAICRGFIEAHGGTITARNRDGGGAVFRFDLPIEGQPPLVGKDDLDKDEG